MAEHKVSQTSEMFELEVPRCVRCGKDHQSVVFWRLPNNEHYSHYADCPETGHPILLRIVDESVDASVQG